MGMVEISARRGAAGLVSNGARIKIVNTFGSQVVDTWALNADDTSEYLSVEHTRRMTRKIFVENNDDFWSNRRNPMLTLEVDTSPGRHDMLVACCDRWLYQQYGCAPGHANCHDNYLDAISRLGIGPRPVPNPVNLWMNFPIEGNRLMLGTPLSKPGDYVLLRALMNITVIMSACPMDVVPINGEDCTPRAVHYEIIDFL
jgi:hypothetical protein